MTRLISLKTSLPLALGLLSQGPSRLLAQQPVTRADAISRALASGSRVALARADSAAANAAVMTARALPNPSLAASYSKAVPQKHLTLDIPFDTPWSRGPRIGAAEALRRAARLRFLSERAAALVEVDTTYTLALAADARFRLSRQTALDADSLRRMSVVRRDAGDASDLDVDLATVTAGQQSNVASTDSLNFMRAMLTVQTLMGLPADSVAIVLADSLRLSAPDTALVLVSLDGVGPIVGITAAPAPSVTAPPPTPTIAPTPPSAAPPGVSPAPGAAAGAPAGVGGGAAAGIPSLANTPSIAAAEASLRAAELAITRERRGLFGQPALSVGFEIGDPTGSEPGYLPLVGISLPLPLFNRNQGPIAEATAARDRARTQLNVARLEARQRLMEGLREREALRLRVARDRDLVVRAERVAAGSLTAYREGASALPAVLEARRSARDVLGQYIDDLAALLMVNTELRALTQTIPAP